LGEGLVEEAHQLHGEWEDDGSVFLDADFIEGLEVAELEGHGLGGHEGSSFNEFGGGVEFAFGVDDLGAAFTLGFGLLGHGAEHGLGHVHLLDFDGDDFDSEGGGVSVDDGLDALIELLSVGEESVEIDLAEDGAEGGLGELGGLVDIVGDFDDGLGGVDDAEGDDGVDLEGDVVAGDDVLCGDFHGLLTEGDADDLVDGADDEDEAWALGGALHAAEAEDDAALVLLEDVDGVDEVEDDDGEDDERGDGHDEVKPLAMGGAAGRAFGAATPGCGMGWSAFRSGRRRLRLVRR